MTPSIHHQLERWSAQLGGSRANQGIKVVGKPEKGYTDIFFGGVGGPDGEGHGHIRVLLDGSELIVREPFIKGASNARRDATLMDDRTKDRRSEER